MDGGLRFWDMRTGDRTADISGLHEGGITSVQFHPTNAMQVLTNGKDSCLKLVDVRTCTALQTFAHDQFRTAFQYSSASFSPDGTNELGSVVVVFARRDSNNRAFVCTYAGTFAASGSSTSGEIFVWRVADGQLEKKLSAH
jgi:autophagy-related protein 16